MHVKKNEILIDRSFRHQFPEWALRWVLPEEQITNLSSFDLDELGEFSLPRKNGGLVDEFELFHHLRESGLIRRCLNLQDGQALIATKSFNQPPHTGKRILLWKSVVCDATELRNLLVPTIQNISDQTPLIYWYWLKYKVNLANCLGLIKNRSTIKNPG